MSTATLQQFGQSLPSWLALVQRGETVAIMDGGHEVARLVPPEKPKKDARHYVRNPSHTKLILNGLHLPLKTGLWCGDASR